MAVMEEVTRFLRLRNTPLKTPVLPLVCITTATSSGSKAGFFSPSYTTVWKERNWIISGRNK